MCNVPIATFIKQKHALNTKKTEVSFNTNRKSSLTGKTTIRTCDVKHVDLK